MSNFNKVILMGRLTKDPELRYTSGGTAVCTLGLAVNHKYADKEEVCFVDITAWSKLAENCNEYLTKGRSVLVEGRLQLQSWESDGGGRQKHVVVSENVKFLPKSGGSETKTNNETSEEEIPF